MHSITELDSIKIVPMEKAHLPGIVRLEQTCFSHPWSLDGLGQELANPHAAFFYRYAGFSAGCGWISGDAPCAG